MKRSEFILKGSMASVALATSTSMVGGIRSLNSANDTVKIGIIGTGSRGKGLISIINNIRNLDVVACCDILPAHLDEAVGRAVGTPKAYLDYRALLDDKDVDAVVVAVPFSLHAEMGIDALKAGKHVYGEKTMAKGYDDTHAMLQAKKPETIFQTGHQWHSSRLYTHVVDLIRNGKIGQIAALECQWNRNTDWRRPVPRPELERLINWRLYREYSGGLIAELSSHQIDFANWVLNATPKQVMGTGGIDFYKDGRETYDNIHVIYSYPGGVEAKFTCLTTNSRNKYRIKIMGSKGTIIIDQENAWFYPEGDYQKELGEVDGVSGATIPWEQNKGIPIKVQHLDPSKQAMVDFRDNIIHNTTPLSNIVTGAKTSVCVQMALDAMCNNTIVKWQPKFDTWFEKALARS